MKQEDIELLFKDLCARLPYEVKVTFAGYSGRDDCVLNAQQLNIYNIEYLRLKPYLRPMSSITEEEKEEIKPLFSKFTDEFGKPVLVVRQNKMALYQDWLNEHHFDYRGLIPMGLAIEVTEENNPYNKQEE